jgi:hypothetical protein
MIHPIETIATSVRETILQNRPTGMIVTTCTAATTVRVAEA